MTEEQSKWRNGGIVCHLESRANCASKSNIETLARTIDDRLNNRIEVSFKERKIFLEMCRHISMKEGFPAPHTRFSRKGLELLIEELQAKVLSAGMASHFYNKLLYLFGCGVNYDENMLRLFDAGMEYTEVNDEDEFYFRDFSFYYTKIHSSSFPLMRNPGFYILFWLFNFYFWSAVFFCAIMSDNAVCPRNDDGSRYYGGWVTSVYFASVTMSTVGYGDVSLYEYGQPKWMTFVAILYMLIAMAFAFTVFSSAVELALSDKGMGCANCFTWLKNKIIENEDVPLYKQVRRLILLRVIELSLYFFILNMVGVFITRAFVGKETSSDGQEWNWMTSLYWAIQTSTTIGYGDLDMPFDLRWFDIFFTTIGTAFVGTVLGSFAGLREEIDEYQRFYTWKRRELSKMLVNELQVDDDKLDQHEFVIGSLLILQKVSTNDIEQIMEKFRNLAGDNKTYISLDDAPDCPVKMEEAPESPANSITDDDSN